MNIYICMYIVHTRSWIYIYVCTIYVYVHEIIYLYIHCTDTSVQHHHHISLPIRLGQPSDASKSQLSSGASSSEKHPSFHMPPPLTDHPSADCLVQTATATGLPQTHLPHTQYIHTLTYCVHTCTYYVQICMYNIEHCMYTCIYTQYIYIVTDVSNWYVHQYIPIYSNWCQ